MNNRGRWFHFARLKALKKHTTPARVFRASLPWHAMGVCLEKRKPNMKPDGSIYQFCYFQFLSEQILFREKNVFFLIFTTMTQGFIALCQNISRVFQQLYSDLCYRGLRLDRYGNCSSILQRIDFRATDLFPVKEKLFSIFMKIIRTKERRTYQSVLERHFE